MAVPVPKPALAQNPGRSRPKPKASGKPAGSPGSQARPGAKPRKKSPEAEGLGQAGRRSRFPSPERETDRSRKEKNDAIGLLPGKIGIPHYGRKGKPYPGLSGSACRYGDSCFRAGQNI